jgi:hypothetical protein
MGHLAASVGKGRSPQVNGDSSFCSRSFRKKSSTLREKPYFVPIIASRTERSDATKTFMTSKTITVA